MSSHLAELIDALPEGVVVTDPDAPPHQRSSMFLIPRDAPGLVILRNVASVGQPPGDGSHGYLRFEDLRLEPEQLLGRRGEAFAMAQARLGGGPGGCAVRFVGHGFTPRWLAWRAV